ncbi:MAG: M20/M25/M40 family metallo-hydrolase, partial [Thermoproteota archaeon]|nr:M20/M25/M40 family metallo-hydrolase [Thermoproteota archaeon]
MELVSPAFALELLKSSLEIYTPSRSEGGLANLIKERCMSDLGFERVNIDSVGNVIATKGSGDPKILLCGHMDTVPGQIPVRIDAGFIYGRGASDAKGPLISLLLAASEFKQKGTIIFAGVVDEEGNATGVKELVKSRLFPDYAIFGEPSGINNITVAYKGRLALRLICDVGKSAHASAPWLAMNSIEEMHCIWNDVKKTVNEGDIDLHKKSTAVTCSLTEISGGSSHNVTPQKCKATIDIRIPTNKTCQEILDIVDELLNDLAKKRNVKLTYRVEDMTESFEADHSSPLVRALSLSILDVCGTRPILLRKTGTGDMNVLGNSLKIPVVTYGPGEPHASHSRDERMEIESYLTSIDIFGRALFHISRLHQIKKQNIN